MKPKTLKPVVAALLVPLVGCVVAAPQPVSLPERRPLGRGLPGYRAPLEPSASSSAAPALEDPTGVLTLQQALALALLHNPELAASSWEIRAAEARTLQASLRPNPELEAEAEEIFGTGGARGIDSAEASLVLSQLVELGGKRARRIRVAALEGELAGWDYEAQRLTVLTDTAKAFVEVLAAQERVALGEELVKLAKRGQEIVAEKIKAGKVSETEAAKARVELVTSQIDLAQARRQLAASRKRLVALWGGKTATFQRVAGQLDAIAPVPSAERLAGLLAQHPDVARWSTEMSLRQAKLDLEKANARADLTLSGGVQYFNDPDNGAFIIGVGVPLPLFDRNQGGIREAKAELAKAGEERRAAETEVTAELGAAYEELASAYEEATALNKDVLPAAKAAHGAVQEGYRQGKFGFLDVLDAQRTLFEAGQKHIDALALYHQALAELEGLIGQSLASVNKQPK